MKKIKSIILCFVLILSIISSYSVFAVENNFASEMRNLETLGILTSGRSADEVITRGEFAQMVASITGYVYGAPEQIDVIFSDVQPEHEFYDAITYCVKSGYISGHQDKTFRPEDAIMSDHVVKVLISVLGYDYLALSQGGYMQGYILAAKSLGLTKGIDVPYGQNILLCEVAKLISNALSIPVARITGIGKEFNYTIEDNVTLFSLHFDMYTLKGVVSATDIASLSGYVIAEEDTVVIADTKFYTNGKNVYDLLGHTVDLIYKVDTVRQRNEIISISKNTKSEEIIIPRKDIVSISAGKVSYTDEYLKTLSVNIGQSFDFIYNGVKKNFDLTLIENSKYGTLKLVSSDGNFYNVMIYENYESVRVNRIDQEEKVVFDKDTGKKYILDSNDKKVIIVDKSGIQIDFSEIKVDYILTIAESADFIKVQVSSDFETIEVTEKNVGEGNIFSSERGYDFAGDKTALISMIDYYVPVVLYLDVYGNIADFDFKKDATGKRWAFLIKSNEAGSNEFEKKIYLKVYTDAGYIETLTLNEDPIINGTKKNNAVYLTDVKPVLIEGRVFSFDTNLEGEISKIETALPAYGDGSYAQNEDGLSILLSGSYEYNGTSVTKSFGTRAYIGTNTVVLSVPSSDKLADSKNEDFSIITPLNEAVYNVTAYAFSKDDKYANVIVVSGEEHYKVSIKNTIGVVTRKTDVIDEDGTTKSKLYVFSGNGETFGYIEKDDIVSLNNTGYFYDDADKASYGSMKIGDVKAGDIISYSTDNKGNIKSFSYIYTPLAQYIHCNDQMEIDDYRIVQISAKEIDKEFITFDIYKYYNRTTRSWENSSYPEAARYANAKVVVVRKAGNAYVASIGTINDIEIGETIFVQYVSRSLNTIIVYK